MKFQPDHLDGVNAISRLEPGRLWVHQTAFSASVLVPWQGEVLAWPATTTEQLTESHFDAVLALAPELVLFGSGDKLRFIPPRLYRGLIERRIGFETMDTAAACRTFNVLVHEGRKVVGAMLV